MKPENPELIFSELLHQELCSVKYNNTGICRGLLAAAAQDDEGEGGAVNALDSASAAGDITEVTCKTPWQSLGTYASILDSMLCIPA